MSVVRQNRWDVDIDSAVVGRCDSTREIRPGDIVQCAAEVARHVMGAAAKMGDGCESFWLVTMSGDLKLCFPCPEFVCQGIRYPWVIRRRLAFPMFRASETLKGMGCFIVVGYSPSLAAMAKRLQKVAWSLAGEMRQDFFYCHDVLALEQGGKFISFRESGLYDF